MKPSKNGLLTKPLGRMRKPGSKVVKKALAQRGQVSGRPTLIDLMPATRLDRLLELVRNGVSPYTAAGAVGISPSKMCNYLNKGREGRAPYASFRDKVLTAQQDAVADAEQVIKIRDPLAFLTRGPVRKLKDEKLPDGTNVPGWTEGLEHKMKHTGPDGISAPRMTLEFTASGPVTKVLPPADEGKIIETTLVEPDDK